MFLFFLTKPLLRKRVEPPPGAWAATQVGTFPLKKTSLSHLVFVFTSLVMSPHPRATLAIVKQEAQGRGHHGEGLTRVPCEPHEPLAPAAPSEARVPCSGLNQALKASMSPLSITTLGTKLTTHPLFLKLFHFMPVGCFVYMSIYHMCI